MKPAELEVTFQIPKFEAQVELLLVNKRCLKGKIFLSIIPSTALGHTPLLDCMNESIKFFPFLSDESTEVEIINKSALVEVVIATAMEKDETDKVLAETVWSENIEVNCHPFFSLKGKIFLDLPANRSRVLDFLNQPETFFALQKGKQSHIINKAFITSVKESALSTKIATTRKKSKVTAKRTPVVKKKKSSR